MRATRVLRVLDGWHIRFNPDVFLLRWEASRSGKFDYFDRLNEDVIDAMTYRGLRFAIWRRNRAFRKARMLEEVMREDQC